ncbi:MAG TPA: hypothetical protein DCE41_35690, partial [Cytophagales bacterium]|nr:hypothetical protein [Cytophagales bacterium]
YNHRLTLVVVGLAKQMREMLSMLRYKLDAIHTKLKETPKMLIPLPGAQGFVGYKTLLTMEQKGKDTYEIYEPDYQEFSIAALLEGIDTPTLSQKMDQLLQGQKEIKDNQGQLLAQQAKIVMLMKNHYNRVMSELGEQGQALQAALAETEDFLTGELKGQGEAQVEAVYEALDLTVKELLGQRKEPLDAQLEQLYQDLKQSKGLEMKLKLGLPLVQLLGVDVGIETKVDLLTWGKKLLKTVKGR